MALGAFIVDDDADVRFLIRTTIELANNGLFVSGEAENGQDALDRLDTVDPAVVILDAMMPEMNGIETAHLIKEKRPDLPLIMCTAYASADLRREAADAGIEAFISKTEVHRLPEKMFEVLGPAIS